MDLTTVRKLVKILEESSLSLMVIQEGDIKIRLEKPAQNNRTNNSAGITGSGAGAGRPDAAPEGAPEASPGILPVNFNKVTEIKSPMVGIFYAAPSPESEPFVGIGSRVKKGDVLCIIDAMKLMNEIVAEADGEIVDICVQNGEVVEYGQIMFKIF